jgi:hypothetical protein
MFSYFSPSVQYWEEDILSWAEETQRYVLFGAAIYEGAKTNDHKSAAITAWLDSGGKNLCQQA